MHIKLSDEQLKDCKNFSVKCAETQQEIEFGQTDTEPRSIEEIGRDNLIGKIAEVAFAQMMKDEHNVNIALDFKKYPRGKWDSQDAEINGWRIDIKGTRQGGKWMLVEWNKLAFRIKENKLSHMYVMASVCWNRDTDTPTGEVELIGCASIKRLRKGRKDTVILLKGEYIPNTTTPLQADNYGILFNKLCSDWDAVINYILKHNPPDLSYYKSPYDQE